MEVRFFRDSTVTKFRLSRLISKCFTVTGVQKIVSHTEGFVI